MRTPKTLTCHNCKTTFSWLRSSNRSKPPKYCSLPCRQRIWRQKMKPTWDAKEQHKLNYPSKSKKKPQYTTRVTQQIKEAGSLENYLKTNNTNQEERHALQQIAYTATQADHELIWRYLHRLTIKT